MRIALFSDTFYPKNDGMSTSTQHLAAHLAKLGHDVLIVAPRCRGGGCTKFSIPGVQIYWSRSIPAGFYPDLRLASWSPVLHRTLNQFDPQVIHAMSPMPISLTGIAYAKMNHLPVVMTFHTYFMDGEYLKVVHMDLGSKLMSDLGWDLAKTVHARADVTVAPTDFVAHDLQAHAFKEPIVVIPSGVEIHAPTVDVNAVEGLRRRWHLNGKRVLVSIGRVSVEKNIRGLLRVFATLLPQHPETHLVLIGDGPDLPAVKKFAAQKKLTNNVTFVGDVRHDQLFTAGYYQLGEFFVTASLSETQGMTSLEAQMCGLPVVDYKSKGLPFVVGDAGVLVSENDEMAMSAAIVDLLEHQEKLAALRARLTNNLARFDINCTTQKMVETYELAAMINRDK